MELPVAVHDSRGVVSRSQRQPTPPAPAPAMSFHMRLHKTVPVQVITKVLRVPSRAMAHALLALWSPSSTNSERLPVASRRRCWRLCRARLDKAADHVTKAVDRDERLALQRGARLWRGVLGAEPLRDGRALVGEAVGLALACSSAFTHASCPWSAAPIRAVLPTKFCRWGLAECCSSTSTMERWP